MGERLGGLSAVAMAAGLELMSAAHLDRPLVVCSEEK